MSYIDILVGGSVSGLGILKVRPLIGLCVLDVAAHIGTARNVIILIVIMGGCRK